MLTCKNSWKNNKINQRRDVEEDNCRRFEKNQSKTKTFKMLPDTTWSTQKKLTYQVLIFDFIKDRYYKKAVSSTKKNESAKLRALHAHALKPYVLWCSHMSYVVLFLMSLVPCVFSSSLCLKPYVLLFSSSVTWFRCFKSNIFSCISCLVVFMPCVSCAFVALAIWVFYSLG